MTTFAVRREAQYIGDADHPLFAVFHAVDAVPQRDGVVVICQPVGYEYMHAHRTLRQLADGLACAGVPTLRFDYHGTGDSPGTDLDDERVARWLCDIDTAVSAARMLSGRTKVCLIGFRLGATLAALTAQTLAIDHLVLWAPCASGKRYMREMRAIAQAASLLDSQLVAPSVPESGTLESAGFMLSEQTQHQLKGMQMPQQLHAEVSVLLLMRDDLTEETPWADAWQERGASVDKRVFGGYVEMMVEPQKSVLPAQALVDLQQWVAGRLPALGVPPAVAAAGAGEMAFKFTALDGREVRLKEQAYRFGDAGYLFGVYCQGEAAAQRGPAVVVMFNAGVAHHVGPNRLYVDIARNLASRGVASLRCDIEGIGDSPLRAEGREHHPYPDTADRDAAEVLRFLTEKLGAQEFVAMGLCSGAYTSFHAALSQKNWPISELVMINPLTFEWHEGDSLDTRHFSEVAHYKGTMRRLDSWKKLLRGEVNVLNLARVVLSYGRKQLASRAMAWAERWWPSRASLLSRQLRHLFARGLFVSMYIASGEPGWDMLTSKARHTAKQALKSGLLEVRFIPEADHTFTTADSRTRVIADLRDHLLHRLSDKRV